MIRSMTGFGAAAVTHGALSVRTEIRSVNHRYLQVKVRVPAERSPLESEIEALVRKELERGAVTVAVSIESHAQSSSAGLDVELARRYHALLADMARTLHLEAKIDLATLVSLPGVVSAPEADAFREQENELALKTVRAALQALVAMREAEGRSLAQDLDKHAKQIARVVARIEKRMPTVVKDHHKALLRRVDELLGAGAARQSAKRNGVQPADLARELALLADRMDVSEEVSRLKSHLGQWSSLIESEKPVGRQLDFLVQEILRESNTLGAKCNDARVAHDVVELKTLIERLREQVQNVE